MNRHQYGLILAGGRGTRFWPLSRKRSSKQVLKVLGERSLIQSTVDRLAKVIPPERLWILTNHDLRDEIVRQLPEIPRRQVLAEPAQRNTAPAIGLAAHILHSLDRDAVMGVFPADHVVSKAPLYRSVVRAGLKGAAAGNLMVVGIQPRWPETGYGYVEFPRGTKPGGSTPIAVRRFHEKPTLSRAKRYLSARNFYWNSGMFFWRADVLLDQLRQHLPKTATILAALPQIRSRLFADKLAKAFPLCDNISIDYAVLEKAGKVAGIAAGDFGWNDVGSWNAVYELMRRDAFGNVVANDSICLEVRDLIVVDTPDALLVATRERAQQVGDIVKALEKANRHELL